MAEGVDEPGAAPVDGSADATVVASHFKLWFLTVTGLAVGLLAMSIALSVAIDDPNEGTQRAIEHCSTLATAGFGVVFGLLQGKSLS